MDREETECVVMWHEDGVVFAKDPSRPGCMTHGDDEHEALDMLYDARACWDQEKMRLAGRGVHVTPPPSSPFDDELVHLLAFMLVASIIITAVCWASAGS